MKLSDDVRRLNPGLPVLVGKVSLRLDRLNAEPKFKSKLEARVWAQWVPLQGAIKALYEPYTFHLTGGSYTPDIVLIMPNGEKWLIEVKGSWRAYASGRSSKRNLKQAASEFAFEGRWFSLMPDKRKNLVLTEIK